MAGVNQDDPHLTLSPVDEVDHVISDQVVLTSEDLFSIYEKIWSASTEWYSFGLALGIDENRLKIIRKDETGCEMRFQKTLSHWLSNEDSPTWQKIVDALCSKNVNQRNLAQTIGILVRSTSSVHGPSQEMPSEFPCMSWEKSCASAPNMILRPIDAVVDGDTAYFRKFRTCTIYSFNNLTQKWTQLPECLLQHTSLVILPVTSEGACSCLHTVGGRKPMAIRKNDQDEFSGAFYQLQNLDGFTTWVRADYPSMTVKRSQVTVVYSDGYVIAAGGCSNRGAVNKVEVLNVSDKKWFEVAFLPLAVFRASQCVCDGFLYILGGHVLDPVGGSFSPTKSACLTSIEKLVHSHQDDEDVFDPITDLPLKESAFVPLSNNVVAIAGWKFDAKANQPKGTKFVHVYSKEKDSWIRLDECLNELRCQCFAVAFEDKIMTVGGYDKPNGLSTDSVEFTNIFPSLHQH